MLLEQFLLGLGPGFQVLLVLLLELLDFGLELGHLLGAEGLLAADREHQPADEHRQQDDREAVVADDGVEERAGSHTIGLATTSNQP